MSISYRVERAYHNVFEELRLVMAMIAPIITNIQLKKAYSNSILIVDMLKYVC